MIKFEKIRPGATLYDRRRTKMGNTSLSTITEWKVEVVSVDEEQRTAIVSWNNNRAQVYSEGQLVRLYDWSMYDEGVERTEGMCDAVTKVRRRKKPAAT